MTLPVLPNLPGLTWNVHKKPTFSTLVAPHVSGRETRLGLYARALYEFELVYEGLDSAGYYPGLQANSLQSLMGFYLTCQGQLNPFLYVDPTDNAVTATAFGTGDGVTTVFALARVIGGYSEPISYTNAITQVTVNGTPTSAYSTFAPNLVQFTTAPASGAALAWTGTFGYQCRFLDDQIDFENFMQGAWAMNSLKFRSIR